LDVVIRRYQIPAKGLENIPNEANRGARFEVTKGLRGNDLEEDLENLQRSQSDNYKSLADTFKKTEDK